MANKMMTLKGNAMWAKVFEPDTKFDPNGIYTINLQMPEEDAAEMCEQLEQLAQERFNQEVKRKPALKNTLSMSTPINPVYDRETGDATGDVEFKFKLKAKINTKAGDVYEQKVAVFDAKRKPIDGGVNIGNGSTVKVAFEPIPYMMSATKTVGVSLRLKAVQVIDLVEYSNSASIFDEEDGYEATTAEVTPIRKDETPFDDDGLQGALAADGDF
jgi:hypothetical protein